MYIHKTTNAYTVRCEHEEKETYMDSKHCHVHVFMHGLFYFTKSFKPHIIKI